MSRQYRYRVAALVLGGLLIGGPMLVNGSAHAEVIEGGTQVTFSGGGVLGLSCHSHPDVESISVPADSTVWVVNDTGRDANLEISGDTLGMLEDGDAAELVFRRGTNSVRLDPDCALGEDVTELMVTAVPSTPSTPDASPGSSAEPTATVSPINSGQPSGTTSPTTRATTRPSGGSTRSPRPIASHSTPSTTQVTTPGDEQINTTSTTHNSDNGIDPTTASDAAGRPGGVATSATSEPLGGVPDGGLSSDEPAAVTGPDENVAAAEPVAAMAPMRRQGSTGLLAMIAAVCVFGVGAGAIRAIVSQRANRVKGA